MNSFRYILIGLLLLSGSMVHPQDSTQKYQHFTINIDQKGSPVILLGDTLFLVHSSNGSFTAKERADAISSRLMGIVREEVYYPDSLISFSFEDEYYIVYRDRTIAVIRQNDTIGTGLTVEEISAKLITLLRSHLEEKSVKFNFMATVKNIGYTLLVVLVLIFIIWILNKIFRKIYRYADTHKARLFRSIKINTYEFLTAEREYQVALTLLKIIKVGLIIFLFLIALPLIFSIFPATEGITRKLIGMVWSPVRNILMAVVNYLPKLITIIIIYLIFKYLIRFVRFLSMEVERGALVIHGFYPDWSKSTYNIIRLLLYAFMFVIIFPYLPGSESPIFRGVSVFLGVLFSLGSSSVVSNIMAGLVITYMRPYKRGDRIKIDDVVGDVVEKNLMTTRIRTIKNEDVTIPNSKVLTGYSVNYSSYTVKEGLIIHTTVTIGYDAPWRTVHELLIKAANLTEGVSKDPQPFVLQTSLDDFYISYQVNAYVKNAHGLMKIKSDMHQNIQDEFNRAGVEIMSPHYRAERDGNAVTIPEDQEGTVRL